MQSNRWTTGALALLIAGSAHASGEIGRVYARETEDCAEIMIEGEGLAKPVISRSHSKQLVALDFAAGMPGASRHLLGNGREVKSIDVQWLNNRPAKIRVALSVTKASQARVEATSEGWRVIFPRTTTPTVATLISEVSGLTMGVRASLPILARKATTDRSLASILNSAPPAPRPEDTRVSLDFVNTDIVQILKALALQSGVNIITAPDVKANLTVSLRDVTVDSALRLVTSLAGMSYKQVEGTYIVAGPSQLDAIVRQLTGERPPEPEAAVTDVYLVPTGQAKGLVQAIAGGKGEGKDQIGTVTITYPTGSDSKQSDESSGTGSSNKAVTEGIVMRGPANEVAKIRELLEKLLAKTGDTVIEAVELQYANPEALASVLSHEIVGLAVVLPPPLVANVLSSKASQYFGSSGTEGKLNGDDKQEEKPADQKSGAEVKTSFVATKLPMRLLLRGTPEQIKQAKLYIAKLDTAPKQVAMELRVMELNREEALRLGIDWSILTTSGTVKLLRFNQGLGDTAATTGTVSGGVRGGSTALATLDAISNKNNLIARPNLMAVDGRVANVFVGDIIRYIQQVQATQNGTTVITGELKVGVTLAILPKVGDGDKIMLQTYNNLSYLTGYIAVPGGGQLPQTSERQTENYTIVNSGETIAIGGLISDQDRRKAGGIPVLKDLPIIGQLFRRTDNSKIRTEVVFFLTAKVVNDENRGDAARPMDDVAAKRIKEEAVKADKKG